MRSTVLAIVMVVFAGMTLDAVAQMPQASDAHKILKKEEGSWNATVKMFVGPAGPVDEPMVSKGSEVNKMLGDFWVVSEFKGEFSGMSFTGQGTFGYDTQKEKYHGMWVDSFSGNPTKMMGSYDAETKTMTYETMGIGMDGKPMKGKNVVVYQDDNRRLMTMYMTFPGQGQMVKSMEIQYERADEPKSEN